MIKYLDLNDFATSNKNLINSIYHFSVDEYNDPNNINFGKLRVLNDELIKPTGGFDLHLHRNLEILSYVVQGELTYKDSLHNNVVINEGYLQHISAGKGIYHSEFNMGNIDLRLIQIWILPNMRNLDPSYNFIDTKKIIKINQLNKLVSIESAPIIINQDVNIYILKLEENNEINFDVNEDRQTYLLQVEGKSNINGFNLKARDALKSFANNLNIKALYASHLLIIEMKKG